MSNSHVWPTPLPLSPSFPPTAISSASSPSSSSLPLSFFPPSYQVAATHGCRLLGMQNKVCKFLSYQSVPFPFHRGLGNGRDVGRFEPAAVAAAVGTAAREQPAAQAGLERAPAPQRKGAAKRRPAPTRSQPHLVFSAVLFNFVSVSVLLPRGIVCAWWCGRLARCSGPRNSGRTSTSSSPCRARIAKSARFSPTSPRR